jgi:hypothetical protein
MRESEEWQSFEGRSDRITPPHHLGFDRALDKAVAQAAADYPDWPVGETREFSIGVVVEIVKTNPGWIGGYKMTLTPTG